MAWLTIAFCFLGVAAGLMSGLLGIGGGLIVVPGLAFLLRYEDIPHHLIMHMAIGTSLATMILTSISALVSHIRRKVVFWPIYRLLMPGIVVGTVVGATIANFLDTRVLEILFALFILYMSFRLLIVKHFDGRSELPGAPVMSMAGFTVGLKSGLLGVGGGALTVPFLTYCNVSIRTAVVVSAATSLTVAIMGTITFMITGVYSSNLPVHSTGFVYWPACIPIMILSLLVTPLGVKLSHHLSINTLKFIFGIFLLAVGIQMLW